MPEDPPVYLAPDSYVWKDTADNWHAGPRSKKHESGDFVSESYAKSVLGAINYRNRVMALVDNPSELTPDTYQEGQTVISEFNNLHKELKEAEKAEDTERIEELEGEVKDLRESLGS